MVDRYRSFLDESMVQSKGKKQSFLIESQINRYDKYIKSTERHANAMKNQISNYRRATTMDEQKRVIATYRKQEAGMKQSRDYLYNQYRQMESEKNFQNQSQMLFIKQHLLKTVQRQLKLDVEMNELVSDRERQRQFLSQKLVPGSQKLKNALNDIRQKRDQIIYLDQCVKQCVSLLEIIGILVLEQGEKIKTARENVEKANQQVQMALKKIDIAKVRSQRSTNRKCCIIVLGLIIIIILLGALGFSLNWF